MNSFMRFAAVNTKIRVMEKRFLKNEDFENLLNKKTVQEVASYLKRETHYKDILDDINENDIHRRQLETLIRKDHADEIGKIAHYFYDGYKKFFRHVLIKREIEELKAILRGISTGKNDALSKESFPNIGRFSKLDADVLLSSRNIGEFIRNLKGTIYYKYMEALEENREEASIFTGEMALDLSYFDMFYRNIKGVNQRDREIVEDIQGINADLLNIQWIYRGLKYYNLPREILYNYTIPHGKEFNCKDIRELCYLKDTGELEDRILSTKYAFLFDNENTKDIFMERRILRYQYFHIKALRARHEMNISESIAFDILLEYEIRDIITVIEGIRYDMPEDEAKRFLIRKL